MDLLQNILSIWNGHEDTSFWMALLLTLLMLILNAGLFFAVWISLVGSLYEYCYPNGNRRVVKKKLKARFRNYALWDKITLFRFVREAPKRGFFTLLCLLSNMVNCLFICAFFVGAVGMIYTRADGWAEVLTFGSGLLSIMFCAVFVAIPATFVLPSERRRYGLK